MAPTTPGAPANDLPGPLPVVGGTSPCRAQACRACCFDTRMPLLPTDIVRLSRRTGLEPPRFSLKQASGPPRLRNVDGRCVFLDDDGCSVYADRPAGCRLYPLVMDPETGRGVLDEDCPHTKGFRVRPRDRAALAGLVRALGIETDPAP